MAKSHTYHMFSFEDRPSPNFLDQILADPSLIDLRPMEFFQLGFLLQLLQFMSFKPVFYDLNGFLKF